MTSVLRVLVVMAMAMVAGAGAGAEHLHEDRTSTCLTKQDLERIVAVVEEKLRNRDRQADPFRKLEDRLSAFERKFDRFLHSANVSAASDKQTKDSSRKIDLMYERVDHRIGFVEAKLYTSFINLQLSSEKLIKRIEKLEQSFETKQNDIEHELGLAVSAATDEIRAQFSDERFAKLTSDIVRATVDKLGSFLADNARQQHPLRTMGWEPDSIFEDFNKILARRNKNTNQMPKYEDTLWKLFESIQNTLKITMALQNLTRRELQDNYKSLLHQFSRVANSQHSKTHLIGSVNNTIDVIVTRIEHKLADLRSRQDSKFHELVFNQKLFMENCHRIQLEEQQLDSKIGLVLERLLDMFINSTSGHRFEYKQMQSTLESHDYQIKDLLNEGLRKILERLLNDSKADTDRSPGASSGALARYIQQHLHDLRSKIVQIDSELASAKCQSAPQPSSAQTKLNEILVTLGTLNRYISDTNSSETATSKLDDDYDTDSDPETDADYTH